MMNEIVNNLFHYASILLAVMAFLVFLTNMITEVVKHIFPRVGANYLVVLVAIGLTVLTLFVAAEIFRITIMWYYAIGAVILGFGVAYAAMIGFDKFLKDVMTKLKEVKDNLEEYR